jgi:hypothetical protein
LQRGAAVVDATNSFRSQRIQQLNQHSTLKLVILNDQKPHYCRTSATL